MIIKLQAAQGATKKQEYLNKIIYTSTIAGKFPLITSHGSYWFNCTYRFDWQIQNKTFHRVVNHMIYYNDEQRFMVFKPRANLKRAMSIRENNLVLNTPMLSEQCHTLSLELFEHYHLLSIFIDHKENYILYFLLIDEDNFESIGILDSKERILTQKSIQMPSLTTSTGQTPPSSIFEKNLTPNTKESILIYTVPHSLGACRIKKVKEEGEIIQSYSFFFLVMRSIDNLIESFELFTADCDRIVILK